MPLFGGAVARSPGAMRRPVYSPPGSVARPRCAREDSGRDETLVRRPAGSGRLLPHDVGSSLSTRTGHTLRSNAVNRMSRRLGAARFASEAGRYLPVNIRDSGRSGRLVPVCAEFQSIGLADRFELANLDKPGATNYGWGASLVRMPAHGPFPGLDAVS